MKKKPHKCKEINSKNLTTVTKRKTFFSFQSKTHRIKSTESTSYVNTSFQECDYGMRYSLFIQHIIFSITLFSMK